MKISQGKQVELHFALIGESGTIKTQSGKYTITAAQCSDGFGGSIDLGECVSLQAIGPKRLDDASKFETFIYDTTGSRKYNDTDSWSE